MRKSALAWLLAASFATANATERWDVQFFHDEDKSSLILTDIVFPTPSRGIAAGVLEQERSRKPVVLVTTDGGSRWTTLKAPDVARSLFCLDETACWMAGSRGVWFSTETGRDWRKVLGSSQILKVYFLSRQHGFAIGGRKTLLETRDGGRTWVKPGALAEVKASEDRMVFHAIHFFGGGKSGLIAGRSEPREAERLPIWMDDKVEQRKEVPALSFVLETRDGGATWKTNAASLFGRISQIQSTERGEALALFEFDRYFAYASELIRIEMADGKNQRVYREADTALTDVLVLPDGSAYAAGFEPPGRLARLPVPGKLRVLRSPDRQVWIEMEVDYRAVARRVSLASAGPGHVWLATDTGMILKLVGK